MNPSETPTFPKPELSVEAARSWCMGLHLSGLSGLLLPIILAHILVPLTIWLLKRSQSYEIDRTGKEVLNFQISFTIYMLVSGGLCFVLIGLLIFPFFFIAWLLLPILAAIKTNNGTHYLYPLTIRFLR
jgi:uncharacterized Tic20 family protein